MSRKMTSVKRGCENTFRAQRVESRVFQRFSCKTKRCKRWTNQHHRFLCVVCTNNYERWCSDGRGFKLPGGFFGNGLMGFFIGCDPCMFKQHGTVTSLKQAKRAQRMMVETEEKRYLLVCMNDGRGRRLGCFFTVEDGGVYEVYCDGIFRLDSTQDWYVVDTEIESEMRFLFDIMHDLPDPEEFKESDAWWTHWFVKFMNEPKTGKKRKWSNMMSQIAERH
jgi:hypothetical protein